MLVLETMVMLAAAAYGLVDTPLLFLRSSAVMAYLHTPAQALVSLLHLYQGTLVLLEARRSQAMVL